MRRPRDGVQVPRRAWVVLAVVCVSIFLVVIDASIVNVAFPTIGADLNTTDAVLSWILTAYNVTVASLLLLAGRTADRLGRKRVFLISVGVFTLGSLLCSVAPDAASLIAFRVVQAIGGSAIFPSSLALVLPEFPIERRSAAVGIWSAVAGFGGAVGPSAGALLIELFGWRGIFWAAVPFGAAVVVLGRRYLTETRVATDTGRLDVIGVPASVLGVALVLLAVVQAEHWGYTSARTLTLACVGLFLLPVLVLRSRRHPSPVLDLSLFGIRSFRVATFATLFFGCAFLGGFFLNSLLLQRLWEWPVWKTGLGLSPSPLMSVVASWWVGRAADRLGHRWLTAAGSGLCVASFAWQFWRVEATPDYVLDFLPSMVMLGAGAGHGDHLHHGRAAGGPGQRPVRHRQRHGPHRAATLLRRRCGRGRGAAGSRRRRGSRPLPACLDLAHLCLWPGGADDGAVLSLGQRRRPGRGPRWWRITLTPRAPRRRREVSQRPGPRWRSVPLGQIRPARRGARTRSRRG